MLGHMFPASVKQDARLYFNFARAQESALIKRFVYNFSTFLYNLGRCTNSYIVGRLTIWLRAGVTRYGG